MRNAGRFFIFVAVVAVVAGTLGLTGCNAEAPPRPPVPGDEIDLEVKGAKLRIEVVFDDLSRTVGMKERKPETFLEDRGMLFIFPRKEVRGFWMRNTEIPLSVAFIDDEGKILQIKDMKPKDESRTTSKHQVRYALEVNKGWFSRAGVSPGDSFENFRESVRRFQAR